MDLNAKSLFFLTQSLLPLLTTAGSDDDPARVINMGIIYESDQWAGNASVYLFFFFFSLRSRAPTTSISVLEVVPLIFALGRRG